MIQSFLLKLKARIPQTLPHTVEELEQFTADLLKTYGLPADYNYKKAVATMIQHLGQDTHKVSKAKIYHSVLRAEAMRSAFIVIQSLNKEEKQKKESADDAAEKAVL